MSVFPPPTEIVPIFNPLDYLIQDSTLTKEYADLHYLQFPVAQGTESMQETIINGATICNDTLTANNNIVIDGILNTNYLEFPDGTRQYTAPTGGNVLTSNNIFTGTNAFNNTSPITSIATQPLANDSSTIIPTTAWVQSAISAIPAATQKTYTVQYTTSQASITLPTNCIGIGIRCIGRGGGGGQAFDLNGGSWNSGGSGGGGGFITSNSIINLVAGQQIQINITVSLSEVLAIGFGQLCRANAGGNGGNATGSLGGSAGAGGAFTSNTSYGNWYGLVGSAGLVGGTNLPFQTASYPASAGTVVLQPWNTATVYGAGQNWNGSATLNSFQGPAISILSGTVYITYYLK